MAIDRRDFIVKGCAACLSATVLSGLFTSCGSTRNITGKMNENGLLVNADEFVTGKKDKKSYHSFLIIRNENLQYPVCLYRLNEREYTALWMQCTHQGTELQVSGNLLHCPAHGSEFDNNGTVQNGPAANNLRRFPVTVNGKQLFIDMRKK